MIKDFLRRLQCLALVAPVAVLAGELDDFTIFSKGNLNIRDRAVVSGGLVGSNVGTQMGFDARHTGDILSRGNMYMNSRATVSGDVTLSGTLTLNSQAFVSGTVTQNTAVPFISIPATAFSAGTADISINNGTTMELLEGDYGNVLVHSNATLRLKKGVYVFNTLSVQPDAMVLFDCSANVIELKVLNGLTISDRTKMIIIDGPPRAKIYTHQTSSLTIGCDNVIEASLTAPYSNIVIRARTLVSGQIHANAVTVESDAQINGTGDIDRDGDGMTDGWEIFYGLDPNVGGGGGDGDGDGLTDLEEYDHGTNPNVADTDNDGLSDGDELVFWTDYDNGSWDNDWEPFDPATGRAGDGLYNLIDPDSDNDGLLDGEEVAGWTIVNQGVTQTVTTDPANQDSDYDGIPDSAERDGYNTDFPNHAINYFGNTMLRWNTPDSDGDGIKDYTERMIGSNPNEPFTVGSLHDNKYYSMIQQMGEWAVSPITGHLNPQLASTSACILGANVSFGDDVSTDMNIDRQMEISVFLPQHGEAITYKLEFVYNGTPDPNDRFYDIGHSSRVMPNGIYGPGPIYYTGTESNTITWRINAATYYQKGDYFLNFSYHIDKNSGEQPRSIRMYAYYDDGTRARIQYVSPVKSGTYRTPLHFDFLVAGGTQPAYFRGETALSSSSDSYLDNIVLTDYNGNTVRHIGRKAFNGYWFQYELGQLASYPGGAYGVYGLNRLKFDWVHDPSTTDHHNIFTIDEVGTDWDVVQITYDRAYQTQDYYCWHGGVAKETAVIRKGYDVRAIVTQGGLNYNDANITIRNRSGADVTSQFNINKEADYSAYDGESHTWRENWLLETTASTPVGMYTIEATLWGWTFGTTSFHLIYDHSDLTMDVIQQAINVYDEDTDGLVLNAYSDNGVDLADSMHPGSYAYSYELTPNSKIVTDISVAAIEGSVTPFEGREAIREFVSKLISGCWIHSCPVEKTQYNSAAGVPDKVLIRSGVTPAEAAAGVISPAHLLVGSCEYFGLMSAGLSRAIGIPSRLVTGKAGVYQPSTTKNAAGYYLPTTELWSLHVWTEAWLENPPTGTDHWYVFDATDFVWTDLGFSASRLDYGSLWLNASPLIWVFNGPYKDVTSFYKP